MNTSITIHSYEVEIRNGNDMRVEGSGHTATVEVRRDVESTVRAYLAQGDYSEGGEERVIVIEIDGEYYRSYAAPRIRRFQSARKSMK